MSLQELFFMSGLLFMIIMFPWKYDKSFLILISMEMLTLLILVFVMLLGGVLISILIILFVFFVSESLIILTIMYNSMRLMGGVYGELVFF